MVFVFNNNMRPDVEVGLNGKRIPVVEVAPARPNSALLAHCEVNLSKPFLYYRALNKINHGHRGGSKHSLATNNFGTTHQCLWHRLHKVEWYYWTSS